MNSFIKSLNYNLIMPHVGSDEVYAVLTIGDVDIDVEVKAKAFRKTDGTGTAVQLQIDVEELVVPVTGGRDGVRGTDYLIANKNRRMLPDSKIDIVEDVDVLFNDVGDPFVIDRTGAKNLFRGGGVATKDATDFETVDGFDFKLKRNTHYLVISSVLVGLNDTSQSNLYVEVVKPSV